VRCDQDDPRHQVVEVAADVGDDAGRCWQPSSFAFPSLGRFGDRRDDDRDVADLWAGLNERYMSDIWTRAAGTSPAWTNPDGTLSPLMLLRGQYLAYVPDCARRVRRVLRRRIGWRDQWTMFVVTDAHWDQAYPASELVNDGPLPEGLTDYLAQRYDDAVDL
jgi:hypothetical protein